MELTTTLESHNTFLIDCQGTHPLLQNLSSYRERCPGASSLSGTLFEFDIERRVSWDYRGLKPFSYSFMINCMYHKDIPGDHYQIPDQSYEEFMASIAKTHEFEPFDKKEEADLYEDLPKIRKKMFLLLAYLQRIRKPQPLA